MANPAKSSPDDLKPHLAFRRFRRKLQMKRYAGNAGGPVLWRHHQWTIFNYPCITTVRLKVDENQLVDVFGEIGTRIEGLKGA